MAKDWYQSPTQANTKKNRDYLAKKGFKFVGGWCWRLGEVIVSEVGVTLLKHEQLVKDIEVQERAIKKRRGNVPQGAYKEDF